MDTLIFTDTDGYNKAKSKYLNAISVMQDVVNAFNAITGISNLTTSDLNAVFNDPDGLIFDNLTSGTPVVIGGLTLNRSKALSIMEPQPGYAAFITVLDAAKQKLPGMDISIKNPASFFQINDENEVEISSSLDAQLLLLNKYFTRCTRAEKEKAFADAVIAAFNTTGMAAYFAGVQIDMGSIVNRVVNTTRNFGSIQINYKLLNWLTANQSPDTQSRPPMALVDSKLFD